MQIGIIYNKSNFINLSEFNIKDSWSVDATHLRTTGANGILQHHYASNLDIFERKITTDSKNVVIEFHGVRELNNQNQKFSINSENKLVSNQTYNNSFITGTESIIINNGDILEYSIKKTKTTLIFAVKNLTTNQVISLNLTGTFTYITNHYFRIYSNSIAKVFSISLTSDQEKNPDYLVVGDSITASRWADNCPGFSISGSPGDTSQEALYLLDEIILHIKPKTVVYAMGANDRGQINIWKTKLEDFKNQCLKNKINFIPITPYANNYVDMAQFKAHIVSNFTRYFDIFSATKKINTSEMKDEYNSGDGIHFNSAGLLAISNKINEGSEISNEIPNQNITSHYISTLLNKMVR